MESLEKVLANLELGSHLCCVYGDREESLSQISLFVSTGLERGEKCLYVVDDRDREDIVEFMKEQGVDVGKYLESGQLEFLTGKESYLKDGYFDPDEMIELIESEEEKALDEGYEGLRITGEMTWVFSDLPGSERLMEYEMNLNDFLPGSKSIGLCQYNEDKFSPETLIDVIYVHPKVLLEDSIYENPYYMPPDLFLDRLEGKVSREHYDRMKGEIRERSELEKRQRLFSVSLEKSSPEVYWATPEGKFVYANETAKEKLGYSEEELEELHVWDINPDYPKEKRKKFWKELKEEKVRTLETIHETKDGVSYPVEMTSHYLEFGWEEYEFAFARDITERKKKEEKLRERVKELNTLYELSKISLEPDITIEEVLEITVDLIPPAYQYPDITCARVRWEDMELRTDNYRQTEWKMRSDIPPQEGEEGFVEVCYLEEKPERDEGPFLKEERNLIDTIAERLGGIIQLKKTEKELRKSEEKFRGYVESSPIGIFVSDLEGNLVEVNETACEMMGYPEEELLEMSVMDYIPPEAEEEGRKAFNEVLETGSVRVELPYVPKDGSKRFWIINSVKVSDDRLIGFAEDITERKEMEEELRKRKRIFQSLTKAIPEVFWVTSVEDFEKIEYVSPAFEEIWGDKPEELYRNPRLWTGRIHEDDRNRVIESFEKLVEKGETVDVEFRIVREDGSIRWIKDQGFPLYDSEGKLIRLAGLAQDITELKKEKERKDFLNTLLRQDLRSNYQTIQGYLQLLAEELDIPDEQRGYLEKAMKAGREADEILGLAKKLPEIEETDWVGEKDIIKVLDQITEDISKVAERKGVEIEKTYPETVMNVVGDYSLNVLFSQILLTRIQISECDTIKLDTKEINETVSVRIEDDGEPLPENIASMFSGEPYTGETTGVGGVRYYMVRQIAEHNNAKIGVEGSELGGARFDVHLKKV